MSAEIIPMTRPDLDVLWRVYVSAFEAWSEEPTEINRERKERAFKAFSDAYCRRAA